MQKKILYLTTIITIRTKCTQYLLYKTTQHSLCETKTNFNIIKLEHIEDSNYLYIGRINTSGPFFGDRWERLQVIIV